jgi:hypothetical protein
MVESTSISTTDAARRARRAKLYVVLAALAFVAIALVDTYFRKPPALGSVDMNLDNAFRIPSPPRGTAYHHLSDIVTIIGSLTVGLTGAALGLRDFVKTRSPLPLLIVLSTLAIVVPETFVDVLGGVYMVEGTTHFHVFTMLGRGMGIFIFCGWFSYGIFPYIIFKVLQSRPTTKTIWIVLGAAALGDVVFEEILLPIGSYHYYGNQPLVLIHLLPWWWIPCNSIGCFLGAAIAYRYQDSLAGWKSLAMFVIMPISVMGVYGFIAMPSFIAVNGDYSWLFTQTLGLITIALGIVTFAAILHLVLQRRPFDLAYSPAAAVKVKRDADQPTSAVSVNPKLRCGRRRTDVGWRDHGNPATPLSPQAVRPRDMDLIEMLDGQTPSSGPMLRR